MHVPVVKGSGTGQLAGIRGDLTINIDATGRLSTSFNTRCRKRTSVMYGRTCVRPVLTSTSLAQIAKETLRRQPPRLFKVA